MISSFGTTDDGREVKIVALESEGIRCTFLDLGCAIRSIEVRDRDGIFRDVVLGYDDADSYLHNGGHFGGIIGRFANRIRGGICPIDGRIHQLSRNRGNNHMHGGYGAYDKKVWEIADVSENRVMFTILDDGVEDGYPGNIRITVEYILSPGRLLTVINAISDDDTVCNIINHSYFNLGLSADITDHIVSVDADSCTPLDEESIPTGEIRAVEGNTDLRRPVRVGDVIGDGIDGNWCLSDRVGDVRHACSAYSDDTGIRMDVSTNMPGMQFYTGNGIKPGTKGKNGAVYGKWSGLCFESQHFPNAPNEPVFPDAVLRKGCRYTHITEYAFSSK